MNEATEHTMTPEQHRKGMALAEAISDLVEKRGDTPRTLLDAMVLLDNAMFTAAEHAKAQQSVLDHERRTP